jgi:hypothetical protein
MSVLSSATFGTMTIPERQTNVKTLALVVSSIASLMIDRSDAAPKELGLATTPNA